MEVLVPLWLGVDGKYKIEDSIVDVESQTLNLTLIEVRIPGYFLENVEVSNKTQTFQIKVKSTRLQTRKGL